VAEAERPDETCEVEGTTKKSSTWINPFKKKK
jgi:hypothetical protein